MMAIKNIIFDFDGVICESVDIKTEAFYEMYLPYGKETAENVKEYHLSNGGMPRFDKFKYYENNILGKVLSDKKMKNLSTEFSTLVKEKVIMAPFVKGALEFLQTYSHDYICFIVSATPMDEMKEIAKEKNIDHYFREIFGSPKNKIEWSKYILETYDIKAEETLFIGDAKSDFNAAQENGMQFLLRETKDNKNIFSNTLISSIDLINLDQIIQAEFRKEP